MSLDKSATITNLNEQKGLNSSNDHLPKLERMDEYFISLNGKISSSEIYFAVDDIFGINLDKVPILNKEFSSFISSRAAIDNCLLNGPDLNGNDIRAMINQLFGINLNGIASLEKNRISLYSKGQWIVNNEDSIFVLHTGPKDVDVKILPTAYFTKRTGLKDLPEKLQLSLKRIGYSFNEKEQAFYFIEPHGQPVPDHFKVQTVGTLIECIKEDYSHL